MRRNSETFRKIYKDFKKDKGVYRYVAVNASSGGSTTKNSDGGYDINISIHGTDPNQTNETNSQVSLIAHESGHALRKKYDLDYKRQPKPLGDQINKNVNASERAKVAEFHTNEILGASHIENIVNSELIKSGSNFFSGLKISEIYYSGKKLEISIGRNGLLNEKEVEADVSKFLRRRVSALQRRCLAAPTRRDQGTKIKLGYSVLLNQYPPVACNL